MQTNAFPTQDISDNTMGCCPAVQTCRLGQMLSD